MSFVSMCARLTTLELMHTACERIFFVSKLSRRTAYGRNERTQVILAHVKTTIFYHLIQGSTILFRRMEVWMRKEIGV